jgi:3'(2'), 5'-bisphosphate nucleotidase
MDLRRELEVAERLAREAGALALRYFGTDIAVEYKGHAGADGPVTRADREANALIVGGLEEAFPGDGLLSEEIPDDGRWRSATRTWMVDPLDGTREFIRGLNGWSSMIGLCVDGRPALGVVYQPATGLLYRAANGLAAERLDAAGRAERLRVSEVTDPAAIRLVASKSHRTETIDRVRAALGTDDELNVGSVGLKLGLIASGSRDLYVNPSGRSSLWDTCGPEAILDGAGGRLTDLAGAPLDYSGGPGLKNARGLVASNGRLHDVVLERIASLFPGGRPDVA